MLELVAAATPSCLQCQKHLMETSTRAQVAHALQWVATPVKVGYLTKQQVSQVLLVAEMVALELASPAGVKVNLSAWTKAVLVGVVWQAALGGQGNQQRATLGVLVGQREV